MRKYIKNNLYLIIVCAYLLCFMSLLLIFLQIIDILIYQFTCNSFALRKGYIYGPEKAIISIRDLEKVFSGKAGQVKALENIDLDIYEGNLRHHRSQRRRKKHLGSLYELFRAAYARHSLF